MTGTVLTVSLTDYLYQGPISTAYDRRVIQSPRIPYYCEKCAQAIDVPTGTEFCGKCKEKES